MLFDYFQSQYFFYNNDEFIFPSFVCVEMVGVIQLPGTNELVPTRILAGEPCKYVLSIRRPDSL